MVIHEELLFRLLANGAWLFAIGVAVGAGLVMMGVALGRIRTRKSESRIEIFQE